MIQISLYKFTGGNDEQNPGIPEAKEMDAGGAGKAARRRALRRREMGKRQEPAAGRTARGARRDIRVQCG